VGLLSLERSSEDVHGASERVKVVEGWVDSGAGKSRERRADIGSFGDASMLSVGGKVLGR
jgi:hypothetical protein